MFDVGGPRHYYAVDHSPSYLWNSATWEISEALLPFCRRVLEGPVSWDADETCAARSRSRTAASGTPDHPRLPGAQREYPLRRGSDRLASPCT
jgi:hypothetical protein